jgi:hypothetical protein
MKAMFMKGILRVGIEKTTETLRLALQRER